MRRRGKDKFDKQARLSPDTVTKASQGEVSVPREKRKQNTGSGAKSGKVEVTKVDKRALDAAKRIVKNNPHMQIRINKDGSVDIINKK